MDKVPTQERFNKTSTSLGAGIGFSDTESVAESSIDTSRFSEISKTDHEAAEKSAKSLKPSEGNTTPVEETKVGIQQIPDAQEVDKAKPTEYVIKKPDENEGGVEHKELERQLQENEDEFESTLKLHREINIYSELSMEVLEQILAEK